MIDLDLLELLARNAEPGPRPGEYLSEVSPDDVIALVARIRELEAQLENARRLANASPTARLDSSAAAELARIRPVYEAACEYVDWPSSPARDALVDVVRIARSKELP